MCSHDASGVKPWRDGPEPGQVGIPAHSSVTEDEDRSTDNNGDRRDDDRGVYDVTTIRAARRMMTMRMVVVLTESMRSTMTDTRRRSQRRAR